MSKTVHSRYMWAVHVWKCDKHKHFYTFVTASVQIDTAII